MPLLILIPLTMVAFAANSILNRLAVDGAYATPAAFAVLRVVAGAVMLVILVRLQKGRLIFNTTARLLGASSLALYMIGFSLAYLLLDAGLGALILFGAAQISMFTIATLRGAAPSKRELLGAGIALGGLVLVLDPSAASLDNLRAAGFMILAGFGWGVYSLAGRMEPDALAGTAANFCVALPLTALAPILMGESFGMDLRGAGLAILSGAVTSGMGYALWYQIVPRISSSSAANLLLSVPVLAVIGGVILLGETIGLQFLMGAGLVIGGIAFSLTKARG
ncbi:MAG: DMT family transporter [Arenibacterium sp.]